jgi:hypothetical protein
MENGFISKGSVLADKLEFGFMDVETQFNEIKVTEAKARGRAWLVA